MKIRNGFINAIFHNNDRWAKEMILEDAEYFRRLSVGQYPEILYIGCSDSRVPAEEFMGVKPGEVFVHRNVANLVHALDLGASSAIEYAVSVLKVKHIVICGHYNCGGVKAAMENDSMGILDPWLRQIRDIYRIHKDELNARSDKEDRYNRLVELNVQEQCLNLLKIASVQEAYKCKELYVHGWVFDMCSGKLINLNLDMDSLLDGIEDIYMMKN